MRSAWKESHMAELLTDAVGQGRAGTDAGLDTEFRRGLGAFDATMVVVGSMIGSGIFLVSADMARLIGSPGWLLAAWLITGVLTVTAALSYGELAALLPRAGGQYVYLREGLSPLWGFLYGWTLFLVIQTGTIAAVAVAFAKFLGVLIPWIADDHYLIPPIHVSTRYALSPSACCSGGTTGPSATISGTRGACAAPSTSCPVSRRCRRSGCSSQSASRR